MRCFSCIYQKGVCQSTCCHTSCYEQEQEKMSFMAIKAPIQGKIKELNEEIDSLIAPGAVFFDTETMGLQAVKTSYGSTNEAVKDPSSKVPAPISGTRFSRMRYTAT